MSNLTILLHPVSDQDTSVSQLVLWGPGAPADTDTQVLYHPIPSAVTPGIEAWGIYEFQPEDNKDFEDGLALLTPDATSDRQAAMGPPVLHDDVVQSSCGGAYPVSTFSSLLDAFGTEGQMPALAPPSPNPSTGSTSPPLQQYSSSPCAATSSSLCDALGLDWLSSPLRLPFSSPSTTELQQPVPIAPTPPPTNIHPVTEFESIPIDLPDSGGHYPLATTESFSPHIEEKNKENHISHQNGGNAIYDYGLVVAQTDIDIRRQGERTVTRKKPEIRVESAISRKRKRDHDSETPVFKPPKFKNQGRRSDLEGFRPPKDVEGAVEKVETVVKKDIEGVVNKDVVKVIGKDRKRRAVSDRTLRELERQEEIARHRAKKRRSATRA